MKVQTDFDSNNKLFKYQFISWWTSDDLRLPVGIVVLLEALVTCHRGRSGGRVYGGRPRHVGSGRRCWEPDVSRVNAAEIILFIITNIDHVYHDITYIMTSLTISLDTAC